MGRSKGEAARAKSRPSSSSVAASLLPSATVAVGFGGYVGSSRVDSALTSTSDASAFLDLDSEIAQHLKRLSRKDPITKVKALQLLSQLIKEKTAKDVVAVVPLWIFEYKKLLVDYNREVRRSTHDTMTNIVSIVRRDLAVYLKPLMGPWWFSQFDSVNEVSQAARRSFQAAFPAQEKRVEALMMYSSEIFAYIEENLKLTPQSLSDKSAALDELEEVHKQVIASSLMAFAALVDLLASHSESLTNVNAESKISFRVRTVALPNAKELFSNHKYFLDYLKSKSAAIRSAAYSLIKSCIENIPHAVCEGDLKLLSGVILGSFQERNPACHSTMWDTLLFFGKRFPDSWAAINTQKTVFSRLYSFLRNGCFGSQQVSYPALVILLETIPPTAITWNTFFLEFFQSLWDGRKLAYSSLVDLLSLLQAVEECYIWGLRNDSRFCDGEDEVQRFKHFFVNEILFGLLWSDYMLASSSSCADMTKPIDKEPRDSMNFRHSIDYASNLGKCIVKILSGIYSVDHDLLLVFSSRFQENCLDIFQIPENCSHNVNWAVKFIQLLEEHAQGETWVLTYILGPALEKLFPLAASLDSPDAVKLILVAVAAFKPRTVSQLIYPSVGDKQFMQAFKEIIIPLCLNKFNPSSPTRLDLLLGFLEDEYFDEEWDAIFSYLINSEEQVFLQHGTMGGYDTSVLSVLIEKVREKTSGSCVSFNVGTHNWHHEHLDLVAICIIRDFPKIGFSDSRFLCAVLGGSSEGNGVTFLSQSTLVCIIEKIRMLLFSFIEYSSTSWVRSVYSYLISGEDLHQNPESSSTVLEASNFFLDILSCSFSCLNTVETERQLVESVVAAIIVIDWEFRWINAFEKNPEAELLKESSPRLAFCAAVHDFRSSETFGQFLKGLHFRSRDYLRTRLMECIRCISNHEYNFDLVELMSQCCHWAVDVLRHFCLDAVEEQQLLSHLLKRSELWPRDATSAVTDSISKSESFPHAPRNINFAILVESLVSELGFDRVVGGIVSPSSACNPDVKNLSINHSRPWLAAEMLCTWKWPGGCVLNSILPQFLGFSKNGDSGFSDAVFVILLDGALARGVCSGSRLLWSPSAEELDSVEGPFLRALLCLISALFEHHVWGNEKAVSLYELLLGKLFIGSAPNLSCLRILPYIVPVLVLQLTSGSYELRDCSSDSSCSRMHSSTVDWLMKCASFPPLNLWLSGEDMEDWLRLALSCFPINFGARMRSVKPGRHVLPDEKSNLYVLFLKQRQDTSAVVNKLPLTQKLLSKLIVISVAYCSDEFDEDDWKYVFNQLRFWIENAAIKMEEVVEKLNDSLPNETDESSELENMIEARDSSPFELATDALVGFFFACGFEAGSENLNPFRIGGNWESITDRIFEGILRLFYCTAASEAISGSRFREALAVVSSCRSKNSRLWELVASLVVRSGPRARDKAMRSFEYWGLSKGPISCLYALLFSRKPLPYLQFAAFFLLSTESVLQSSSALLMNNDAAVSIDEGSLDASSEENVQLRSEVSDAITSYSAKVFEMDLDAHERVTTFVSWCLLLTYAVSLPSSSPSRNAVVQHVRNSASTAVLDCIFQHIPLDSYLGCSNSRKKKSSSVEAVSPELSLAAGAASRAVESRSVAFAVESLWPVTPESMASLAGAVFGLMLHSLPAYVRGWFGDIRDRSTSSAIESFTRAWCSPLLISDELLQVKKAKFGDENFSISVSKTANEIVGTYTKDEAGMDLVIRLPQSYPLRPVDVDCTRSLGINVVKQRKWLLSMMSFVRNQNGAIAEAIRIWKSNFDKEFEGVEDCPICFSVIHTANHSLPRLACKTCKNKFHSACLYKWFSTSHKSLCPLCQNTF